MHQVQNILEKEFVPIGFFDQCCNRLGPAGVAQPLTQEVMGSIPTGCWALFLFVLLYYFLTHSKELLISESTVS